MVSGQAHICVCICTYRRRDLLKNLLKELQNQRTENLFTYSIVVVDNDRDQSARDSVESFKNVSAVNIEYYTEPEQNIALARNKAVQNAKGDLVAFIDDDEFPINNWLLNLYKAFIDIKTDGILGPVLPYYETSPPQWIIKGKFYERPTHKTGTILNWEDTRTGNVLLRKSIFNEKDNMFRAQFGRGGEDRDFFRRMILKDLHFAWCAEAPVYELVPLARYKRSFMLKRALLRGEKPLYSFFDYVRSLIAIPLYTLALPLLLLLGHHLFMRYLIKDCDHIGRFLYLFNIDVIKQKYVMK